MRPLSLITQWSTIRREGQAHTRRLIFCLASIMAFVVVVLFSFLILSALPAVLMAVVAGVLVRCIGQQWNLRKLRISDFPANLASFNFEGGEVQCRLDELVVSRYIHAWKWRISAAISAGCVCLAALHFPALQPDLLSELLRNLSWIHRLVQALKPTLPVLAVALFLAFKGPTRYWGGQVKRTVQGRASASVAKVLSHHEIRGLGAGIDALWRALGIERQGEYQAAIERHLKAKTGQVVPRPESAIAMQETMIVLGRQDLRGLGDALGVYRSAECGIKSVQTVAAALRNPVQEMRAEELSGDLESLRQLVAERCWSEFHRKAAALESKVQAIDEDLRDRAIQGPTVVLAPGSDPYQLLGIAVDTPTPLIRKLRIRLAQLYHPDISDSAQNGVKMAELNAAYDAVMKDREKRGRA